MQKKIITGIIFISIISTFASFFSIECVIAAPYTPSNPTPDNSSIDISVMTDLSWTGGGSGNNRVTYDVYFGTINPPPKVQNNKSKLTYNPPGSLSYKTEYFWRIVAWDKHHNSTAGPLWKFTTISKSNDPPNTPSILFPSNGTTGILVTDDLSWTGGDPNGDPVTYDVYFGTISPPLKVVSNQSRTSYNPGTMNYFTIFYWKIIAWDNRGTNTISPTWHFTTQSYGGGGDGGGSEPPAAPSNKKPIADASAGEPYQGIVNSEITFDGSKSSDSDGTITKWLWVFGDNTNGAGRTIRHIYSKAGTYTVTLMVTDNEGATNTDTTTCVITQPNRSPTKPIITGTKNGPKNTLYTYTALSTDADNDFIQYWFDWGDPQSLNQSSGFLPNGTSFTANHSWMTAGRYIVTVTVTDNQTVSSSKITVYIDAVQISDIGYLIDNNGDGIYDTFSSDISKEITMVQKKDGNYNIDSDGNGVWDHTFNAANRLTSYQQPNTPGFEITPLVCAIALIFLWKRKREIQ